MENIWQPVRHRHHGVDAMSSVGTIQGPVELAANLVARCLADGQVQGGILVGLTVVMLRKNHYGMIFGPSDHDGEITIPNTAILDETRRERDLFPMDYEDLSQVSGELIVEPMGLREVESALKAYEVFKSSSSYPSGHGEKLNEAWKLLYEAKFKRLEVKLDVAPFASSDRTDPSARAFRLMTRSIVL